MSQVLVTGATGFLGEHVVTNLLSRGCTVRALVRRTSDTRVLEQHGVALVIGDVMTGEGMHEATEGVDAVIHVAGGGKVKRMADMDAQNTASPAHLLAALDANNPTARLVLTSSMAAMGPARNRIAVRPDDIPHPVSAYGRSKLAAERLVLAARDRRHVSIVRPPGVYGPGDTRFLALFRSIERGLAPVPPGRTTSVVYGPDCADALVRCAFEDFESGTAFHVEDGEVHTWRSLADHVAHALGKRPFAFRIPKSALWAAGAASEVVARVRDQAVVLTRDKWRDGKQKDWLTTSETTQTILGWQPTVTFAEGARVTGAWYRAHGWI